METHEHLAVSYNGVVYDLCNCLLVNGIEQSPLHGNNNKLIKWREIKTWVFHYCGIGSNQKMNTFNLAYNCLIRMPVGTRKLLLEVINKMREG